MRCKLEVAMTSTWRLGDLEKAGIATVYLKATAKFVNIAYGDSK